MVVELANRPIRVLFAPVLGIEYPIVISMKTNGYKQLMDIPGCASIPQFHLLAVGVPLLCQCLDINLLGGIGG